MLRLMLPVVSALVLLFAPPALAQEGTDRQGPPPAKVVVVKAVSRDVVPRAAYLGTVYFPEVSDVAAEVGGRVVRVRVEDGARVRRGELLVETDTSLLEKSLAASRAALAESRAALERERLEFARLSSLFESRSISEQDYDNSRYRVVELERRADALAADVARMDIELAKAAVAAPYSGVVLSRRVDRGEWLAPGVVVAVLARDDAVDVRVNVPAATLAHLRVGIEVPVRVAGRDHVGRVIAIIPEGDVATRTFPVKVRVEHPEGLAQGMEAEVRLPVAAPVRSVVVPRDAVLGSAQGQMLFAVADGAARPVPVTVTEYFGLEAAVSGEGLAEGMDIVIKGNERLRPGQSVTVVPR
ncbi:RND family efflux transporter MFP subunit [Desulfobaculum xiamenense]|uniref:RND family efflux transporter MFP subunit n=1 Tax=Desulfobaculum xiamenense TaxID=995050 RepID=A0A846QTY6_9BACT|nr:efflux RND transporter periplasmic adaptor subunit [Desulfobaculum xiamenense]NJB68935.1 RND family efflux transporter MFP subunit [Desulfobaculum xiamenense]